MKKNLLLAAAAAVLPALVLLSFSCSSGGGDGGSTEWNLAGDWDCVNTITSDPCDQMESSTGPVRITQSGTHITIIDQYGIVIEGTISGDHISGRSETNLAGIDCKLIGDYNAVIWDNSHLSGSTNYWWTGDDCGRLSQCTATSNYDLTRD